jgi:hypothetical protein
MDNLATIGLGLALRTLIDMYHSDYRIGGVLGTLMLNLAEAQRVSAHAYSTCSVY